MYKRFSLDELTQLNTSFFDNLKSIYTKQQHIYFKQFLDKTMEHGPRVYFYKSNKPIFRIQSLEQGGYRFVDEQEKLELFADTDTVNRMHNLFKNTGEMKAMHTNKTILDGLMDEFQQGQWNLIHDQPYVVYDIETTFDGEGIMSQHFEMAYSISSGDDNTSTFQYKYIDRTTMKKYCDYLLAYDGWIIGYNQIGFDNPVLIHNVGYGKEELEILNRKSIDPFLFLWKTLGKRMSLNNVAQALISSGKTLTGGKEGEELLQKYKQTGDEKLLRKVKKYCKNDVHITLGVFLSLLKHRRINVEGKTYEFTIEDILHKGGYAGAMSEKTESDTLFR